MAIVLKKTWISIVGLFALLIGLAFSVGVLAGTVGGDDIAHAYRHGSRIADADDAAGRVYAFRPDGTHRILCEPTIPPDAFDVRSVHASFSNVVADSIPFVRSVIVDVFAERATEGTTGLPPGVIDGRMIKLRVGQDPEYGERCERRMIEALNRGDRVCSVRSSFRVTPDDGRQGLAFHASQIWIPSDSDLDSRGLPLPTAEGRATNREECPAYLQPAWDVVLRGSLRVVRQASTIGPPAPEG